MSGRLAPEQLTGIRGRHAAALYQVERIGWAPYSLTRYLKDIALLLNELDAVTRERNSAREMWATAKRRAEGVEHE